MWWYVVLSFLLAHGLYQVFQQISISHDFRALEHTSAFFCFLYLIQIYGLYIEWFCMINSFKPSLFKIALRLLLCQNIIPLTDLQKVFFLLTCIFSVACRSMAFWPSNEALCAEVCMDFGEFFIQLSCRIVYSDCNLFVTYMETVTFISKVCVDSL